MTLDFVHETHPTRVIFAPGSRARLADETARLGLRRLVVVCTPGQVGLAEELAAPLGAALAEIHPHAVMHVPGQVAAAAAARMSELDADGIITLGGGSAIGLGKAVAKDTGTPLLALPTTYSGSEMTPIWGVTDGERKTTGRDPRAQPAVVIYDPELTLTLPVPQSVTSAVNALAHSAEALYAPDRSPVTSLIAAESARAIVDALPRVADGPDDTNARSDLLYGAWLGGAALGATTMSLHHKLCHILGGTFGLPHAETHTAVLPHVLAFNLGAAASATSRLQGAFGVEDPSQWLYDFVRGLGAEVSLTALGMPVDGVSAVIDQALSAPYSNPKPVTAHDLEMLLSDALTGAPPRRAHAHLRG